MTAGGPATPGSVLRWMTALGREAAHAPHTLRLAREALAELTRLPAQLERLTETLERTVAGLELSVGELSTAVGGGMHERLEHLDSVVSDLRDTLTGLIGVIPGMRRTLQNVVRQPRS